MLQTFTTFVLLAFVAAPQAPPREQSQRKPVLIRDDRSGPEAEVFERDPARARKFVEVGDFYYKRDKFEAAEARYRDAIRYDTAWPKSYEKLIELLEKTERLDDAIAVCDSFIAANPDSKKLDDFARKADELRSGSR